MSLFTELPEVYVTVKITRSNFSKFLRLLWKLGLIGPEVRYSRIEHWNSFNRKMGRL